MKKLSIVLFVAAAALAGCGGKAKPAATPDNGSAAGSDAGSATGGAAYGGSAAGSAAGSATPAPAGSGM